MPEGIPLTTLIKVIIGAIGACQMPSLPSQLPRSPWTQLHASLWGTGWQARGEAALGTRHLQRGVAREVVGGGWAYGKCPPPLSVSACRRWPHIHLIIICAYCCHIVWHRFERKKKLQWLFCTCSVPDGWGRSHERRSHIASVTLSITMSWRLHWR